MMRCLFCETGKSFTTKEHIIPQSLGNTDLILEKQICDKCQNYLSQIENYVLNKTPIGFWRVLFSTKTKKNKLPFVDFTKKDERKGIFPDFSDEHDNIQFQSHSDFSTELIASSQSDKHSQNNKNGELKYVITPKVIHEIGRFLGKIGIEIICQDNPERARLDEFKSMRRYVREGCLKDLWPIFHMVEGDIKSLFEYIKIGESLEERVVCYSYKMLEIGPYIVFNLKIGTDSWFIPLNQQFPHPGISELMGKNVNTIWYSKEQWKR